MRTQRTLFGVPCVHVYADPWSSQDSNWSTVHSTSTWGLRDARAKKQKKDRRTVSVASALLATPGHPLSMLPVVYPPAVGCLCPPLHLLPLSVPSLPGAPLGRAFDDDLCWQQFLGQLQAQLIQRLYAYLSPGCR